MKLTEALDRFHAYHPHILIMGINKPKDGEYGMSSCLVSNRKDYEEAIKQYEMIRVFKLKEFDKKEIELKLVL